MAILQVNPGKTVPECHHSGFHWMELVITGAIRTLIKKFVANGHNVCTQTFSIPYQQDLNFLNAP